MGSDHGYRLVRGCGLVLGLLLGLGIAAPLVAMDAPSRAKAEAELKAISSEASKLSRAFELIHEIVGPSVVSIHTHEQVRFINRLDLSEQLNEVEVGEGSGFVFHSDRDASYVLTNSHVVLQTDNNQGFVRGPNRQPVGYEKLTVVLNDSRHCVATYIGYDLQTDLAVLKIPIGNLPALEWADSDEARVGDWVLALGYPFGVGYSATAGIISATDRSTGIYAPMGGFESFIQTDAAINPGNSGGPLVCLAGKVVGVNSNIITRSGASVGLGFAIPSNLASRVADDLLRYGRVKRAIIGIYLDELDPDQAASAGLPSQAAVRVSAVLAGSPAAAGGLLKGDAILAVNHIPVASLQQFRSRVASCRVGVPMDVTISRADKSMTVSILPIDADAMRQIQGHAQQAVLTGFGLSARLDGKPGAVVTAVVPDGAADRAGIEPGDRLLHERSFGAIRTLDDLIQLSQRRDLVFEVVKNGKSLWIALGR